MARVIWSDSARENLHAIAEYIALDSLHYAKVFVQRIIGAVERLRDFPKMGRTVPEYDDKTMREVVFHSYRIIYRLADGQVVVLAVVHASRDLGKMLIESDQST